MYCTIINDCRDANAAGRQATKVASLLGCPTNFIGVKSDLEAAGNLVDALDAGEGKEGIVLVNVAPRSGRGKKWQNGSPFGYFWYKRTLVVSTIDGFTLSLVKKLQIVEEINILDCPVDTQFRSYEFLPKAAESIFTGKGLPSTAISIDKIVGAPHAVWWIDNFGNCKTTLLIEEKKGGLPFISRLKDVPNGESAIVVGSSGIGNKRFLEVVVQGGSAAEHFKLSSGSAIL